MEESIQQQEQKIADLERVFPITGIARNDLLHCDLSEEQVALLSDADMEWIAYKMANAYTSGQFWTDADIIARRALNREKER